MSGAVTRSSGTVRDDLELQADPYPYGVWEPVARVRSEGSYVLKHAPDRNTRYRVVDTSTAPAKVSKTFQVYLYPDVRWSLRDGGSRAIGVVATIRAPTYLNLNRKRLVVYRSRTRRRLGLRAGSLRIRRTSPTKYRAAGRVRANVRVGAYYGICFVIPNTRLMTRLNGRRDRCP